MNFKLAQDELALIKECAVAAGVYHAWFLSFGTCLGAVRPSVRQIGVEKIYKRGFIDWDRDMDIGILSEKITKEQEFDYVERLKAAGLFADRSYEEHNSLRTDNGRHCWFSLRKDKEGVKCCHWAWFNHAGYSWHSKGALWCQPHKFDQGKIKFTAIDDAVCLGVPQQYLEDLVEIQFEGGAYNIPLMAGSVLDYWYKGWAVPRTGGASAKKKIMIVHDWKHPEDWSVVT